MWTIWYNPNLKKHYMKYVKGAYLYSYYVVGYKNQFDHELIFILFIHKGQLYNCKSFDDYCILKRRLSQPLHVKLKNKFFNWIIEKLERSVKNGR